jgi:7-cyano-7-deazaguanine synthase in queuosine biosynthesis
VFQHTDLTYFSKQEAWDIIPDEIKKYVWTCRNPQYKINRQTLDYWCADACGECRSCQEAAGLGLSKYLILKDL